MFGGGIQQGFFHNLSPCENVSIWFLSYTSSPVVTFAADKAVN